MLTRENFTAEYIEQLKQQSRKDPALLEKAIYAFGLLEALSVVGMPFIFKGGSCLMLLLEHPMRLSTDIDIIVAPGTDVDDYLKRASQLFPFKSHEEQVRKGKNNIIKRHFKFRYDSPRADEEIDIILDILFEESKYKKVIEKPIQCDLILTEPEYAMVRLPDINSILADKMTAFAPHTTGVLLDTDKDMEIMKQMFDVYTLICEHTDFQEVAQTYHAVVADEIAYRGKDVTAEDVLMDTYEAALCIASRGVYNPEEYRVYLSAIRSFSGHVYGMAFSAEVASRIAPAVMYMAICLMKNIPFEKVEDAAPYTKRLHSNPQIAKALKHLKKSAPEAYAYSIKADELLNS